MRKLLWLLLMVVLTTAFALGRQAAPGQLLVKFRNPNSWSNAHVHRLAGGKVVERFPHIGVELVQLRAGFSVANAARYYKRSPAVLYAEPNYIRKPLFRPNDANYDLQYAPGRVFAEPGWDIATGDPGTVIAVIDSGVDLNHPDLRNKLVPGYDFSDDDPDPSDNDGHGTHCAGIAAADTNNGIGIAGIGFNCKIMPLKIFPQSTVANLIRAVTFAVDNGADVLSMSIGGGIPSQAEEDIMEFAVANNVLPVAAAGNDDSSAKSYPAGYDSVLAVGSTDANDQKSDFSNFGDWVDVAAPGSAIYSTLPGSTYGYSSGTSMSCPAVAGYAGLLYSHIGEEATVAEVRSAIEQNCEDVGDWLEFGLINVSRGLTIVIPPILGEFDAQAIAMYIGSNSTGNVTYVQESDGLRFLVESAPSVIGQMAGAEFSITMNEPLANVTKVSLEIEANGPQYGTGMVWLFNWRTNRYDYYKAFPLTSVDRLHSITILNLDDYVSPAGEVRAVTRAHVLFRMGGFQPFTYRLNEVKLAAVIRRG